MTQDSLVIQLLYRLPNPSDALTLHALLAQQADVDELRTSASRLSSHALRRMVSPSQVRHAFRVLEALELITVRVHPNYRTLVTVRRDAVLSLLHEPVSETLPGLSTEGFPFLDHAETSANRLLLDLFYRLPNSSDALVLFVLLSKHADEREFQTSANRISHDALQRMISPSQVRNSLKTLQELELVKVRVHANYRTLVSVQRDAVLALLRKPVSETLPGLSDERFPFLDYLDEAEPSLVPAHEVTAGTRH